MTKLLSLQFSFSTVEDCDFKRLAYIVSRNRQLQEFTLLASSAFDFSSILRPHENLRKLVSAPSHFEIAGTNNVGDHSLLDLSTKFPHLSSFTCLDLSPNFWINGPISYLKNMTELVVGRCEQDLMSVLFELQNLTLLSVREQLLSGIQLQQFLQIVMIMPIIRSLQLAIRAPFPENMQVLVNSSLRNLDMTVDRCHPEEMPEFTSFIEKFIRACPEIKELFYVGPQAGFQLFAYGELQLTSAYFTNEQRVTL
jgi:hypothetical protein